MNRYLLSFFIILFFNACSMNTVQNKITNSHEYMKNKVSTFIDDMKYGLGIDKKLKLDKIEVKNDQEIEEFINE